MTEPEQGWATITAPPATVIKFLILGKREGCIDAIEAYNKMRFKGASVSTYIVKSRLLSLFFEIQAALANDLKPEEYNILKSHLQSDKYKELEGAWETMNFWLYKKRLTKFDLRRDYDSTMVEEENAAVGL